MSTLSALPNPNELLIGALAFLRIGGIIFALPVTGDAPTPVRARVLLSLALTFGLYPIIPATFAPSLTTDVLAVGACVIRELMIGLVVGFVARMLFDGILLAASVVSYQMGFGTANLFMPDFGGAMDGFTAFHRILVMLMFFTLGLDRIFFDAIVESFRVIPAGAATLSGGLGQLMIHVTAGLFVVGLQLAAPLLVALLFAMAALGLMARTVPQLNVFTISFPVSFAAGILVYVATLPFFPDWMQGHFDLGHDHLLTALRGLAP